MKRIQEVLMEDLLSREDFFSSSTITKEMVEYLFEFGWGDLPALKDVNACCPRCADRNRNGQSVVDECMYCADVPEWALKLESLGLAHMVLTDSGWKWEI